MTDSGRVLIGGVGYRWQRDASFGLAVSDALAALDWPAHVQVADLGYGALYVTQDLADAEPPYHRLVLVSGTTRGRAPGKLYCERWQAALPGDDEIQERVREAGAGVVDLDHLLIIASYFRALPDDVVALEFEPVDVEGGDGLSPAAAAVLPEAVMQARALALAPVRQQVQA
jgi:hydrogenase maturation protease